MKRKFVKSLTALILCVCTAVTCLAAGITLKIDGSEISSDVAPQIIDGRTMVPLRAIFENIGASVDWDSDTKTITADKNGTTVIMTVGSTTEYINGSAVTMDVSPQIIDGRTLVPAKYAAEAFGYSVSWDSDTKTVDIVSSGISSSSDNENGKNSFGIDPARFVEIRNIFYNYVDKVSNATAYNEVLELYPSTEGSGDVEAYTVSIPEYQALIDSAGSEVEIIFIGFAVITLKTLIIYRLIDLKQRDLTGSIPSQSNYDACVEYAGKIFEAASFDDIYDVEDALLEAYYNYKESVE